MIGHTGLQEWILVIATVWTIYSPFSIIAEKNAHGPRKASEISFSTVSITWMGALWASA